MRCAFTKRRLRDHLLGLFVAGGGKCKAAGQHSAGRSGGCFASARKLLSLCAFFTFYIYLRTVFVFFRFFFFTETGGGARPAIVVVVVLSEGRENGSVGHPPLCFSVGGHEHMDLLFPRALIVKPPNDNDKFSEPPATKQELSSTIVAHCSGEGEN
jgi:hypothetical protein